MNERITLLALKASDPKTGWLDRQKFAQLIVRECLRELQYTVLDTQELRRDRSKDYQVGWEDGMFDAGEMIKQHFGVEE
jgi:hypothetical protein